MKFAVALVMAVALCHTQAAPIISDSLESIIKEKGSADIMILLKDQTSKIVSSINSRSFINSNDKTTVMVQELRQFTEQSQKGVMDILSAKRSSGVKSFWITNRISVKAATWDLVVDLKGRSDIEEIREAHVMHLLDGPGVLDSSPQALEWGVNKIDSPLAWAAGHEGEGIVVSTIDTGVRRTHESLINNERDTHSWYDPYDRTATASDGNGHGTHTMGTIAGTGGTGVAPKSKWIACRGCGSASCTEEALLGCGQWTTCPHLPDGTGEDCSKKPHLSSNSWGGGQEDPWFNDIINAWHAASIVPVFAIGNSGPGCRTANSPGDQQNVISVGATTLPDAVASFSSHGPTLRTNRIKPEVSAPGQNVRSASNAGDRLYAVLSGTSMACPHVAGSVAVLLSKNPSATFLEIIEALQSTTERPEITQIVCTGGGVNQTYPWPNNSFGWGRVNLNRAQAAL